MGNSSPVAGTGAASVRDVRLEDSFREAMGRLAAGVVMVTCSVDGKPWGLTVTACCSVSIDPPLLLVSLGHETLSAGAVARTGRFGISLLGESSVGAARFASAPGQPKFVSEFCHSDAAASALSATPVVAHALAHVDCTVEQTVAAGDHVLHIGRVQNVLLQEEDRPLVYYLRSYYRLGSPTDLRVHAVPEETVDHLAYDYPMPLRFTLPPPGAPGAEGELGRGASG
jgi:flavin reductase (DIM6/NTAB) family NADH-FMN oxidoreductase RutF